ncbi:DUF4238 domain-containing protein [Aestuariibius sp. HNIBRBA575]|uniref:DUF4238 domain-containing protein n=1 Tax=Aestuariibius sp. HNIBRBA575 TaxID=3233343 RepID=UPI0034A3D173
MSASKNHHYIPRSLLKNFTVRGDQTFHLSRDSATQEAVARNIKSIFKRRSYNTLIEEDGKRNDDLEVFFGKQFDNYIPEFTSIFNESIATSKLTFPSPDLRARFVQFFYNHRTRTPDFSDPIVESSIREVFTDEQLNRFESENREICQEERVQFFNSEWQKFVAGQARVINFSRQSGHILNILNKMEIIVATPISVAKKFIIGSNPVVRFENYPEQELGDEGVELWTTFSPEIAVGFVVGPKHPNVIALPNQEVLKLNRTLARNSKSIAGTSSKLLKTLSKTEWSSEHSLFY